MKPNGSDLRRLTDDPCQVDGAPRAAYPDYTSDGANLVFVRGQELYTMTAGGMGQAPLGLKNLSDQGRPSVSPNGARVAYTRVRSGHTTIYTAKLNGTDVQRLRRGSSPRYSPDGRTIAYLAPTGAHHDRARGHRQVRPPAAVGGSQLDWAPGGRRFVYATFDDMYVVRAELGQAAADAHVGA